MIPMRTKIFVSEAWRSITSNLSTAIAATMTVLIGMFLLGLFIALFSWVDSYTESVKRQLVVNVYFCTAGSCGGKEVTEGQIEAVRKQLVAMPEVQDVKFISKEDAWEIMKQRNPELFQSASQNPLPDAFQVLPRSGEQVRSIAAQLEPKPAGVEEVKYGEKTASRILKVARVVYVVFIVGSFILIIASILLIANTIRLSIFSRRREIEVMKLVGATNWFVRGPFMLEGLITGLVGSLVAVILLLMAREIALPTIIGRIDLSEGDVHALAFPWVALIMIGTSLAVGALGSGITLRRFLQV
jgi:cell division transport system permease protein